MGFASRSAVALVALTGLPSVASAVEPYGWTVSASSTDPYVQTASPTQGLFNLWLWLVCDEVGGVAAAEFDLTATGDLFLGGIVPTAPSVLNGGSPATSPLLVFGGCPTAPMLVATLLCFDLGAGGALCMTPSAVNGINVTVDCSFPQPRLFPNAVLGFSSDGTAPCVTGTCTDPTSAQEPELRSWGGVKGMYR